MPLTNEAVSESELASSESRAGYARWANLVERIKSGDLSATEELYGTFTRGIRYYLVRHLGAQELDDRIHDAFVIVLQAIRSGSLREPERLMGFVRTVVRRQVAAHIETAIQNRKDHTELELGARVADRAQNPEETAIRQEKSQLMGKLLEQLSERDREILTRFYVHDQSQEQICREMDLTDTQFRLLKSRAKGRLAESGRRQMIQGPLKALRVRTMSAGEH